MPPICAICRKDFRDSNEGGLVYFRKTKEGKEFEEKCEKGFVGHHPDAAWFCGDHIEEARKLKNLTIDEALEKLRKK